MAFTELKPPKCTGTSIICQIAINKYLEKLSSVDTNTPTLTKIDGMSRESTSGCSQMSDVFFNMTTNVRVLFSFHLYSFQ